MHRPVEIGGQRLRLGEVDKLNSYYKEPNYPGQETAVLTKLSNLFKRGAGGWLALPWSCLAPILILAKRL